MRTHLLGAKAPPATRTRTDNHAATGGGSDANEQITRPKKVKTKMQEAEALVKKALLKIGVADSLEGTLQRSGVRLGRSL